MPNCGASWEIRVTIRGFPSFFLLCPGTGEAAIDEKPGFGCAGWSICLLRLLRRRAHYQPHCCVESTAAIGGPSSNRLAANATVGLCWREVMHASSLFSYPPASVPLFGSQFLALAAWALHAFFPDVWRLRQGQGSSASPKQDFRLFLARLDRLVRRPHG